MPLPSSLPSSPSSSLLSSLLDLGHAVLAPAEAAVAHVLVLLHGLLTAAGLDPAGGAAWSLAVVGLVVLARTLLLPLFVRQQRAAATVAALRPQLLALQRRYGGRTDPAARRELQQRTAELYRGAGTSPLAGCLPGLLQAPVLLALTLTLQAVAAARPVGPLSGAPLEQLGAATLAGAPLSGSLTAAWGADPRTVLVAGLLVAASALLQLLVLRLSAAQQAARGAEPVPGQAAVQVVLPVVVAVSAVHFPVGVLLYWAVSAAWSAAQQAALTLLPAARRARRAAPPRR
ncbi:membrane protein insertase YidC [Kineococcus sp. SYSU DK006]|uniref:membrane protein insertase YidC n=1 Tax=Kineococcus sp. SYSU DK006 TaxID=3383127 RepID=UPI003D7D02BB